MDEKSEEELERIANKITAEMVRNLNAPQPRPEPPSNDTVPELEPEEE